MTEYCRLCADLKDFDEIVASIDDAEQEMEQKLRACCQWTDENTEHQLPRRVCSICFDKLEKSWLFAQSVLWAQQQLLEIFETDTKPSVVDHVTSNDIPSTSAGQSNSFTDQFVYHQNGPHMDHNCEICAQKFQTDEELNEHRRQGCGGLLAEQSTNVEYTANEQQSDGKASKKLYPCDKCDRVYRGLSGLYLHQNTHTGARTYKCQLCNKTFSTNSSLTRHTLLHNKPQPATSRTFDPRRYIDETLVRPFKCSLCADSFVTRYSLKRHLVTHVNRSNGALKIVNINKRFRIIRTDGGGEPVDVGRYVYACDVCNQIWPSQFELQNHRATHTDERPFECWACHKTFKSRRGLNKHLRTHSLSAKNAVCKICSNEFGSSAELNAHQQHGCEPLIEIDHIAMDCKPTVVVFANEFHGDNSKSIGNDLMNVDDEQPANAMNRKKNDTKGAAKRSNPQLECPECGKKYASKTSLNNHRHIMHLTENTKTDYSVEIDGKRRFKCPLCDMTFTMKFSMKRHLLIHVNSSKGALKVVKINDRYCIVKTVSRGDPIDYGECVRKCDDCDQFFVSITELNEHRKVKHSTERLFECWLCHKTSKTRQAIKMHMRIHVPNGIKRNSICELCGKAFGGAFYLSHHMQSAHSNERPHKCETCGLGYKTQYRLRAHKTTAHTDAQFKCNQCDKSFRSNHTLKLHLETHTGSIVKPFVCDFCAMGFRRNMDLQDHRRIHTGEMPYSCEHCTSRFRARSSYYTHLRTVHGISLLAQNREKMAE